MSYSLSARGATKQEAVDDALAQFAKVVELQPVHARDQPVFEQVVRGFVGILPDAPREGEPPRDFLINVSGWLSHRLDSDEVTSANIMVTSSLALRKA